MNEQISAAKLAEQLMRRPGGATMDEIIAATGGPQYNLLRKLEARGYSIRKVKEGRATRYFATPPDALAFEATLTEKGQVTMPKEIRDRLGIRPGGKVRFTVDSDGRVEVTAKAGRLQDLFGILGKPPRSLRLEEIDDAIAEAVVEKHRRSLSERDQ